MSIEQLSSIKITICCEGIRRICRIDGYDCYVKIPYCFKGIPALSWDVQTTRWEKGSSFGSCLSLPFIRICMACYRVVESWDSCRFQQNRAITKNKYIIILSPRAVTIRTCTSRYTYIHCVRNIGIEMQEDDSISQPTWFRAYGCAPMFNKLCWSSNEMNSSTIMAHFNRW